MRDIVERLREYNEQDEERNAYPPVGLIPEAADEIERLREWQRRAASALRVVAAKGRAIGADTGPLDELLSEVRTADQPTEVCDRCGAIGWHQCRATDPTPAGDTNTAP